MENIISFFLGVASSALVSFVFFRMQKKTDDVLISASELHGNALRLVSETQNLQNLLTTQMQNEQERHTHMLKMAEELAHHTKEQVEDLVLPLKHPEFFASDHALDVTPTLEVEHSDQPRLGHVLLDSANINPGDTVGVLFRVNDDNWNFSTSSGASVVGYKEEAFQVKPTTAKYMYFSFPIPVDYAESCYTLRFTLIDIASNTNNQIVNVPIGSETVHLEPRKEQELL